MLKISNTPIVCLVEQWIEDGVKTFNLLIDATDTDHMKTDYDYTFDIFLWGVLTLMYV